MSSKKILPSSFWLLRDFSIILMNLGFMLKLRVSRSVSSIGNNGRFPTLRERFANGIAALHAFLHLSLLQLSQIALSYKTFTQIIPMKHSEWLRLQADSEALASLRALGDRIVASLRADGFTCRKQPRRLSWYLCSCSVSYTLTKATCTSA
jgi:hypothetical protein